MSLFKSNEKTKFETFQRFGNMFPTQREMEHPYLLNEDPFHNDTYMKAAKFVEESNNPFIDSEEWHRFWGELKTEYTHFLQMTSEEVAEMFSKSQWEAYCN